MRVAIVGFCAALAACQAAGSKPEDDKPRASHWGCTLEKAKNPARIDSATILSEFPEYREAQKLGRASAEYYFAVSRVTTQFDQAVLKVVREEGFDCVIEKSSASTNQRLPDITFHVLRYILAPDDRVRGSLVEQVIAREEETWTLLRNAADKESKLQAALNQVQQLGAQRDQLQLAIQNEQAKVQQIEATLAGVTREKIQVEAARGETKKNNETLTAELNKTKAELASLQQQSQAHAASLQAAQKQVAELQALKNQADEQLKAAAEAKVKFEQQLAALTKQVNELSGSNAALNEQVAQLKNDKNQLEQQLGQVNAAKGQADAQLAAERTRAGALEKRVQELEVERKSRLAQLQKDATDLSAQLTVIQQAVAKFAGAKPDDQQLADVKNQVADLEVKVRVVSAELTRVSNLDKQTQDRIKTLTEAVTVLKQQISTFAR
jgi:chromosome segregation ATPase